MVISKNIKYLRKKNNLTLRELAEKSGLTFGAIGNLERGVIKDPHISTVIKLSKVLNISIDELVSNRTN